jgi:hypothetical protein
MYSPKMKTLLVMVWGTLIVLTALVVIASYQQGR